MAEVIVSRLASKDLINIRDYIRDELNNPDAASRILLELKTAMESLRSMPERGKPLDSVIHVHTEYRYLVCGRYRVFYLYHDNQVEIVRVLQTLQDYMRALFTP